MADSTVTKLIDLDNLSTYHSLMDAKKVDAVSGKGLSTNDFTNNDKSKLDGIAANAEVNVQSDWNESSSSSDAFILNKPTALSAFSNDTGFITKAVNDLTNYYTTSNTYTQAEVNALVSAIPKFSIEVTDTLLIDNPSPTTIYLLTNSTPQSQNLYTEYIYVIPETGSPHWEKLGEQTVDLTGYIQGSGTSGYIAKFNGTGTITNGPQLGSGTTTYLRNDGTWVTPDNTTYTLSAGSGDDASKIILTPSSGSAQKVTVPYASDAGTVNGKTVAVNVPADAKFTDTTYNNATTSSNGLMSSSDKYKLVNIATEANKVAKTKYTLTKTSWVEDTHEYGVYYYQLLINNPKLSKDYPINIYLAEDRSSTDIYYENTKFNTYKNIYMGDYSASVEQYPMYLILYYINPMTYDAPSVTFDIYVEGVVTEL